MKFALFSLAIIAAVAADVSELSQEYLPPVGQYDVSYGGQQGAGHGVSGGFGSHGVSGGHAGHGVSGGVGGFPTQEYLPPVEAGEPLPGHVLDQDGYRYKTHRVKKLRYRARRFRHRN